MVDYLPPKKITSGQIFWNQMSRTMFRLKVGWTFCLSIHHHLSISSPRQPPRSAAPLRVYPRDGCKDCECKGCVNQVVFFCLDISSSNFEVKTGWTRKFESLHFASGFTMETKLSSFCFLNKIHRSEDVRKCWRWMFLYVHQMPLALWMEAVHLRDDFGSKQLRRKTSCRCKQKPLRI